MMHGEVCGDGGVAVDGEGLRSAALNCLTVYRPAAEVIAAVCGRGKGDFRACCNHAALQAGNLAVLCAGAYAVLVVYCGHSRSVLTVFYRNNGRQCSIVNVDTVVLRVACLARLVGVNNQSQLVTCLYGVVVRLEIYGVVTVLAILKPNLVRCGSRAETCVRVCKVDPAACNNLVLGGSRLELDYIVILSTAADPVDRTGLVLGDAGGVALECLVRYVNQHCAHHQRITAVAACSHDCNAILIFSVIFFFVRNLIVRIHDLFMIHAARSSFDCFEISCFDSLLIRMLNRSRLDVYLDRTLDNGIVLDIIGVHCARGGGRSRERITPAGNTGHVAVNGGRTLSIVGQSQLIGICRCFIRGRPCIRGGPAAVNNVALYGNGCHILSAIVLVIQIMTEPLVQNTVVGLIANQQRGLMRVIVRGNMCALMQQQLDILAFILKRIIHQLELLGTNVIVVQTVNDEGRAAKFVIGQTVVGLLALVARGVVTGCPVRAIVTVQRHLVIINTVEVLLVNILHAVPVVFINITASAVETEVIRICRITASRDTLRVGVLIPACDTCNRNDGLEVCYTGRRNCKVGRAAVGTTGHSNVAVRPVSRDFNVVLLIGICNTAAVLCQPFNDALECVSLYISAASLEALRAASAQTAYLNNRVASNEEVIVPVEIFIVVEVTPGAAFIRADIVPLVCRCFLGRVHRAHFSIGNALILCRTVQAIQVVAQITLLIGELAVITVIRAAGDVRTCVHNGCKIVIIRVRSGSTGKLHQRLYEIELAIAVGVVVGLNVNRVADDVALIVAVALCGRNTARVRKNRLCNAVYEQRSAVLYCIAQVNSCCAVCHRVQLFQRAGCGTVELVICDAYALRHSDVVAVAARELRFLHAAIQQNVLDRIQLGQAAALCRSFERRIGRYLLSVIAAVCINSARLTGERQDHGKHQREAGRSLLHVYSLFRGKYRISTPVLIIQRWIFYRSFEF